MAQSLLERIEAIWHMLSREYDWQRIPDPAIIIAQVAEQLTPRDTVEDSVISGALIRHYYERLYHGLQHQEERAVKELQAACQRRAAIRRLSAAEQEDLANETVKQVIERLNTTHDLPSLLSYTFLTLDREARRMAIKREVTEAEFDTSPFSGVAEPHLPTETVEQKLINDQLLALLQKKIPNPLQQHVVIRTILLGEKPREVAQALGISALQVRLAKHRGLSYLRADAEVMAFCDSLHDDQ